MDKSREFLKLAAGLSRGALRFTPHFKVRKESRGVGESFVEELVLDRKQDLIYVEKDESSRGLPRYKAYYSIGKKKALKVIIDAETDNSLSVVTSFIIDKKVQLTAIRNARQYSKLADRL